MSLQNAFEVGVSKCHFVTVFLCGVRKGDIFTSIFVAVFGDFLGPAASDPASSVSLIGMGSRAEFLPLTSACD